MDKHNSKKPWYKRVWVWILIVVVLIGIAGASGTQQKESPTATPAPAKQEPAKEEPTAKWDMEAAYAKIQNGMTKTKVEEITGKKAESCTESENEYTGKTELCTYGNVFIDKGSIIVTFSQGAVSSKTKSTH